MTDSSDSARLTNALKISASRTRAVTYLISRRLPWVNQNALAGKVPFPDPSTAERVSKLRAEFSQLDDDELFQMESAWCADEIKQKAAKAEAEEAARPFNALGSAADFDHWSRCSYWTIEEAVALTLGREPSRATLKLVTTFAQFSPFAKIYLRLHDLVRRAVAAQQLTEPTYLGPYIAWARRLEIDIAPGLLAAVEARGVEVRDWKSLFDGLLPLHEKAKAEIDSLTRSLAVSTDQLTRIEASANQRIQMQEAELQALHRTLHELHQAPKAKPRASSAAARERGSMLKLIAGLVVAAYGAKPVRKRSEIPAELASDLEKAGVPLDVDTVRKYLKEAADILPPVEDA